MKKLWCWRCRREMPMLDENEWPAMMVAMKAASTESDQLPLNRKFSKALECYASLTGEIETNPNALWHHRESLYGPPCTSCGKVLRTPNASKCFECGAVRNQWNSVFSVSLWLN